VNTARPDQRVRGRVEAATVKVLRAGGGDGQRFTLATTSCLPRRIAWRTSSGQTPPFGMGVSRISTL